MSGKYNRVGSKKGPLVIGGAIAKIEQDPTFVYVPMYRVAGPEDEVVQWLKENHPDEAKTALKGAYTKASLKKKDVMAAFEKEVESASRERQEVSTYRNEMKQVNLMVLVKLLQLYSQGKKSDTEDSGERKTTKTLKDKLAEIQREKKFLDVTGMTEKGTESKKVPLKKGSLKRHLSQNKKDVFHHVIYNPSSKASIEGVSNFMRLYGTFTDDQMATVTEAISSGSIINLNKAKSPTRSPLVSPKRAKGKKKAAPVDNDLDDLLDALPVS